MPVIFPPSLPQDLLLDGYQQVAPQMVRRSTVDQGPAKVGRRYTANVSEFNGRLVMTRAQLIEFDDFYFGPAGGGSVAFEWKHPLRRDTVRMRFRERPSYTNGGHPEDIWVVNLAIEILPPGMPA